MLDIAIVAVVIVGMVVGWRKGFITPVIAQVGAVLGLWTIYNSPLAGNLPSGPVSLGAGAAAAIAGGYVLGWLGAFLVGLISRVKLIKRLDQVCGVPLGAVAAGASVYLSLVGAVTLDGWLGPLHDKTALSQQDIAALQQMVATNPAARAFADPAMLSAMAEAAAKSPVTSEQVAKVSAAISLYEHDIRPQLLSSHLAPLVLSFGADLPIIGRHVDYPKP
jgi:uncharacterized membrane protein required for colicin V production